ncbi:MAG: type I-F CRISPR-associated endoribonuclease Cas6/Csy4 [Sulfuricurvum sp.]|nr:type I-F CRISPR-associated endoribonuclease Cas6/Csy4 [Sulfuricurvum sp.]
MKHYIEITLLPSVEVGLGFLWQKVYQQIHLALVEIKDENDEVNVGISFPKYGADNFPLGDTVRLFGKTADDLTALRLEEWLKRLSDYVAITAIKEVPQKIETYMCFSRKQVKSNTERLARRQAKRKGISFEEAMLNYENMQGETTKLPFIVLDSLSTGQRLKLFIQNEQKPIHIEGNFNTFGLSKESTIPWF